MLMVFFASTLLTGKGAGRRVHEFYMVRLDSATKFARAYRLQSIARVYYSMLCRRHYITQTVLSLNIIDDMETDVTYQAILTASAPGFHEPCPVVPYRITPRRQDSWIRRQRCLSTACFSPTPVTFCPVQLAAVETLSAEHGFA